jgi:hypothetical protein
MEGEYKDGRRLGRWLCALGDGRGWTQEWRDDVMVGETVRHRRCRLRLPQLGAGGVGGGRHSAVGARRSGGRDDATMPGGGGATDAGALTPQPSRARFASKAAALQPEFDPPALEEAGRPPTHARASWGGLRCGRVPVILPSGPECRSDSDSAADSDSTAAQS